MDMFDQIKRLRSSTLVKERSFGDISSFNFTRKAFFDAKWNELTTKARGLFINTRTGEIVSRGYDKFFNIDENQNNRRSVLKRKLAFPAHAYRKENGFLGLISLDEDNGQLRLATKASLEGPYAKILEDIFRIRVERPDEVVNVLRETKGTILVEVIDPVRDPHIIEYKHADLIVLDIVKNEWETSRIPYSKLVEYCKRMGLRSKQLCETYETWVDLETAIDSWITEDYREDGEPIEGYVIEDRNGFMFKVKTGYYTKWKKYRKIIKGIAEGIETLGDPFLKWATEMYALRKITGTESIIALRNMYEDMG